MCVDGGIAVLLLRLYGVTDNEWTCTEYWWNDTGRGKVQYLETTCYGAILFTINPIRTGQEWNPGVRVGNFAANPHKP